jgi:hypothetical protein
MGGMVAKVNAFGVSTPDGERVAKQATWQPHKPHKTTQLIKKHMRKTTKAHVFTLIRKGKIGITKAAASMEKTV